MSDLQLCLACEGNGVLPVRNERRERIGVQTCRSCSGLGVNPYQEPQSRREPTLTIAELEARLTSEVLQRAWFENEVGGADAMRRVLLAAAFPPSSAAEKE